ncbi:hypothetical protein [Saccharopolyspora gregorii]|uniref:Uncharacterized protein n=1 Tax=Saccharopolyspora gregorii TaxID=33914 RepID=A0ABP6RXS6_9PSEU|nr:hypothetical protein [Saccharopolyspora gregorii]
MMSIRKKVVVAAAGLAVVLGGAGGAVAFAGTSDEPGRPVRCAPVTPLDRDQPGLVVEPAKPLEGAEDEIVGCAPTPPVRPGRHVVPAQPGWPAQDAAPARPGQDGAPARPVQGADAE